MGVVMTITIISMESKRRGLRCLLHSRQNCQWMEGDCYRSARLQHLLHIMISRHD